MDCSELVERITDYLEGAMAPSERALVDEHLAACDGCSTYLDQLRTTIRLTGMLTQEQVPERARARLLEAFRATRAAGS